MFYYSFFMFDMSYLYLTILVKENKSRKRNDL